MIFPDHGISNTCLIKGKLFSMHLIQSLLLLVAAAHVQAIYIESAPDLAYRLRPYIATSKGLINERPVARVGVSFRFAPNMIRI